MTITKDDLLLSYLAGIADGEGCFRIEKKAPRGPQKTPKFTVTFSVQMCEKPVIELFASRFQAPVSRRHFPPTMHKDGHVRKTAWRFQISAKKAAVLISTLLPFLVGKKEQAKLCLEFYEKFSTVRSRAIRTAAGIEERQLYHDRVRDLKRLIYT